jgi:hypothetical protein
MEKEEDNKQFEAEKSKIIDLLKKHNIDISSWGSGEAKTINDLVSEIISGESQLTENENGEIIRFLRAVAAIITFTDSKGKKYQLVEDRQEFVDGRIRKRERYLITSISEKMMPDEEPKMTLVRGIKEELGISVGLNINDEPVAEEKEYVSYNFPGFKSKSKVYTFNVSLDAISYNPDGYIERQPDKTTFFVWEKIR